MRAKPNLKPILIFCLICFFFIPDYYIQFFLFLFFCVNLLAYLQARLAFWAVVVKREQSVIRLYKGESAIISFIIENRSIFPITNLFFKDKHGELFIQGENQAVFNLKSREQKKICYTVVPDRRGLYFCGPIELSGSDSFCFFPWKKQLPALTKIIVYPHVFSLSLTHLKGLPGGELKTSEPAYEDLTIYRSLREYLPGDELKRISWKVSARFGRLITIQFQPALSFSALVLLNLIEEDYQLKHRHATIEYSIQMAASLVFNCISLKQEMAFACYSYQDGQAKSIYYPAGKSGLQATAILEALALVKSVPEKKDLLDLIFETGFNLRFGCRLLYVGPKLSACQLERLLHLKRAGLYPEFFLTSGYIDAFLKLKALGFTCYDCDKIRQK